MHVPLPKDLVRETSEATPHVTPQEESKDVVVDIGSDNRGKNNTKPYRMPLRFNTYDEYMNKLLELLDLEMSTQRDEEESFACNKVAFEFVDRYEITCRLKIKIERQHWSRVKQGTLLSVNIATIG